MNSNPSRYSKPGQQGGRLIRQVIGFLKEQGVSLPLTSHILIGLSGGIDSVALAHLLTHYGRRIVDRSRITFLHINHQWRGEESDQNSRFVENLGKEWGIPVVVRHLEPPQEGDGSSWEEKARTDRKKIFQEECDRLGAAVVLTAHQADDLAETLIWRLCTGAAQTHSGGIAVQHGVELRPFLRIRKSDLLSYLNEMKQDYHEDSTNFSNRFLRARMRTTLMPEIEKIFPKAIDHLIEIALNAQNQERYFIERKASHQVRSSMTPFETLLQASGLRARRNHFEFLAEKVAAEKTWQGEVHLPGGWKLIREKKDRQSGVGFERWILEKIEAGDS